MPVTSRRSRRFFLVAGLSCALAANAPDGSGQEAGASARATTLVANPGPRGGEWKRAFNPFRDDTDTRWPATAGVYEPLLVYSRATRSYQPWLATGLQVGRRQPHRAVRDPPRGPLVRRPAVLGQGRGLHLRPDAAVLRARPRGRVGIPRRRQESPMRRASSSRSSAPTRPGCSPSAPSRSSPSTSGRTWPSPRPSTTRARWAPGPSRRCGASSPTSTSWAGTRSTGRRTSSLVSALRRAALSHQRRDAARPRGRRAGLGVALRGRHREAMGGQGPHAPPLLVPGLRADGAAAAQHAATALRRRLGAQGGEHGPRPAAHHARGAERLRASRRRHRPRGVAEPVEGRRAHQGWRLDAPGRGQGQRAPRCRRARPGRGRRPLGTRRGPDALRPRGRGGLVGLGCRRRHHPPEPGRGRDRGRGQGRALRRVGGGPRARAFRHGDVVRGARAHALRVLQGPDGLGARQAGRREGDRQLPPLRERGREPRPAAVRGELGSRGAGAGWPASSRRSTSTPPPACPSSRARSGACSTRAGSPAFPADSARTRAPRRGCTRTTSRCSSP